MTSQRIVPAAVVLSLVALNWYAAQRPIDITPIAAPESASSSASNNTSDGAIPASTDGSALGGDPTDNAFQERPLFSPTRRPREQQANAPEISAPVGDTADPASASAEASGLRLIGVMQIGRDDRRALIRAANAPNGLWLAPGGEVDGWRISTIEPETVVIAKSGGSEQLILQRRSAGD